MGSEEGAGVVIPSPPPTYEASITSPLRAPGAARARFREAVESYMLNSKASRLDGSIHPALDTSSDKVLVDSHKFVPITSNTVQLNEIYRDVEAEKTEFIKSVDDYNAKAKSQYKIEVKLGEKHSFVSLMDSVESAARDFKEKSEQGVWGKIRTGFRQLGEEDAAFRAWLELLPSDSEYFSVICGGLKLILGAAKRTHDIRNEIATALCEIPSVLCNAQRMCRVFDWSDGLRKRSAALWASIMRALGHILSYFKESTWRKLPQAVFLQSSYKRDLSSKLHSMQKCSDEFIKEADTCNMELARNTNDGMTAANMKIDRLERKLETQQKTAEAQQRAFEAQTVVLTQLLGHLTAQPEGLGLFHKGSKSYSNLKSQLVTPPSSPEVYSGWEKGYFGEEGSRRSHLSPLSLERSPSARSSKSTEAMSPLSLGGSPSGRGKKSRTSTSDLQKSLSRLSFETHFDSPKRDLKHNLALAFKLGLDDQDRAVHLIQSSRLQSWLTSPKSSALLVNGNGSVPAGKRGSPLSFVVAKILDSLQQASSKTASGIISLHYFCGEHIDQSEDPDASAAGLMNSLLAQLLTRYEDFDLSIVHNLKNVDTESIDALCTVFSKLISLLPEEMLLFCAIDGLSYYDDDERREDAEELLKRLTILTRTDKRSQGCKFKLLLTARKRLYLKGVRDCLEREEIFTLPPVVESGDGFSAMKWNLKAGRSVRDLTARVGR